ncbi:MAG: GIY-YIG nuclease family protein [Treponematales bacterium]
MEWVYCLQNPSFAGLVKIGQTADLEKRLKDLNRTNLPQEFEILWAVSVANSKAVETSIFKSLDDKNLRFRSDREFFFVNSQGVALEMAKPFETNPAKKTAQPGGIPRKRNSTFDNFDLHVGDSVWLKIPKTGYCEEWKVEDEKNLIRRKDTVLSVSAAAQSIAKQPGGAINGWMYLYPEDPAKNPKALPLVH